MALDREFDYEIPPALKDAVRLGSRVIVPFGKTRRGGYIVGLAERSARSELKKILSLEGETAFVDEKMLKLVRWMADYYCASLEQAMRTVLPGAVRRRGARFRQKLLVSAVEAGIGRIDQERLRKRSPKQGAILDMLLSEGSMFLRDLIKKAGTTSSPLRALEEKGAVSIEPARVSRDPLAKRRILRTRSLTLTSEQASALVMIKESIDVAEGAARCAARSELKGDGSATPSVVLLHGVTGSGKTEIYLQAIAHILERGQGAIVLVPEISLTPQTVDRFVGRFGDRIAVLHSHLSDGERHDEWHRIREGGARIVIGARSAVFAPVRNLGLIVVDEEHEPSYKQEEAPRYNARDVAVMRGRITGCTVVLGSATPSLESWSNAKADKYKLARLRKRVDNRKMPVMHIVDMRIETERSGHVNVFSKDLLAAIRQRLDRAEQTILFLNRRGFATSLICPRCGHVARCDQCSVTYTYHRKGEELRCHVCGGRSKVPRRCPGCQDPAFKFVGIGTQRVEVAMTKCFPGARMQRMDADITRRKGAYDSIFDDFRVGKIDILIGTQMIAKGLHFPNVTLVGVIYADLSLHMPDFRASERTFQLLAQVAGRAGRGEVPGEVIVQTYTPFHVAVQAARRLDYDGFCDQEIEYRRELMYPPLARLLCITLRGPSEEKVSFSCAALARQLKKALPERVAVSDACPAPLAKAKGRYRYQIMVKSRSARAMTDPLKELLRDFKLPVEVTCSVDMDALSLM